MALRGGEVLGKLYDLGIEVRRYTVRVGALDCAFYEAHDSNTHQIGAAKGDGRICRIKGVKLDMILVVDHLFDQGFLAIDEDDGYTAAIDA